MGRECAVRLRPLRPPARHGRSPRARAELDIEQTRTQLIVELDTSTTVKENSDINLWFDDTRMHLFDPLTGTNLTARDRPGTVAA